MNYSAEEDATIRANWKAMTSVQLQRLLPNREARSIAGRAHRLKLDSGFRHGCSKKGGDSHRIWTIGEEKKLKELIATNHTRREAATILGRTMDSIKWKMATLGLRLTPIALKKRVKDDTIAINRQNHQQAHAVQLRFGQVGAESEHRTQ